MPKNQESGEERRYSLTGIPYRELGVYHLNHGIKNLLICDSSATKTALYYVDINTYTKNTPDVRLYSLPATLPNASVSCPELGGVVDGTMITGETALASGQVVGTAWFRNVQKSKTRIMRLCLGDPEKVRGVVWVDMLDVKKHSHGEYAVRVPASEEIDSAGLENPFESSSNAREIKSQKQSIWTGGEGQRTFQWVRTHSKDAGLENAYISRKWSAANFKLVDEEGRIVAVFESNGMKSFRKMGKLKIYRHDIVEGLERSKSDAKGSIGNRIAGYGCIADGDLEELTIVLSYCVIQEKYRRGI